LLQKHRDVGLNLNAGPRWDLIGWKMSRMEDEASCTYEYENRSVNCECLGAVGESRYPSRTV
jgi:hypothetical protein